MSIVTQWGEALQVAEKALQLAVDYHAKDPRKAIQKTQWGCLDDQLFDALLKVRKAIEVETSTATVWHSGTKSMYNAILLNRVAKEEQS